VTVSPAPSASASPAPSTLPEITGIQGATALWFLLGLVLLIVLAWLVPLLIDLLAAYRSQRRERVLLQELIQSVFAGVQPPGPAQPAGAEAPQAAMSVSERKLLDLLSAVGQPPTGTRGLNRALMAFSIVTVIGVLSVALLFSGATDAAELRKTIVVGLIGVLATIVGFYFGSRTATEAQAKGPTGPQPPPGGASHEHLPGVPPPPGAPPPGAPPPGAAPGAAPHPPPGGAPPAPPPGGAPPAPPPGGAPHEPPPDH
jgi:hypothetical protein